MMKPKKILIFSLSYFPKYVGGAEVAIKEITDRLDPMQFEFHMVTLRYDASLPTREKIGNVLVHRIGFSGKNPSLSDLKKFPLALNKFIYQVYAPLYAFFLHRKYRYDILWAMMAHATGIAAAIFTYFAPRVRYVLTLQEGDPPEYIERLARPAWPLFTRAFRRADRIHVISNFLGAWALKMGFSGKPILIPNGVDVAHFSQEYTPAAIQRMKDTLGKNMGDVFLVTASRLVHKNAVDDVLRALPNLPNNVKFIVLGEGPDEKKLKEETARLSLEGRVRFMGTIGHAELPLYLRACDIFIRPSRSEGMGNSFIEAFVSGLPVIATQEGGLADIIFGEKLNPGVPITAWAVPKNSPEAIVDAVHAIMENPEKVRNVVETARVLAREKYDWNTIARDMQRLVFSPLIS